MKKSHLTYKEFLSSTGKTRVTIIKSSHDNSLLGVVQWSGAWRQYVFQPNTQIETIWSHDCLEELKNYIIKLNNEKKNAIK